MFLIGCATATAPATAAATATAAGDGLTPAARVIAAGDGRTVLLEPLGAFDPSRVLVGSGSVQVAVDRLGDRVASAHVVAGRALTVGELLYPTAARLHPGLGVALSRVWVRVRPVLGLRNVGGDNRDGSLRPGVVMDLGAEITTARGLRLGAELAPLAAVSTVFTPSTSVRFHLGYATLHVAISLGLGCSLAFYYPQAGPLLRLGRLDRAHALLRLTWSIYPPRIAPVDAQLEVNVPLGGTRARLHLEAGGAYGNLLGVYGLAGAQLATRGNGGPRSFLVTAAVGVAWVQYSVGPALSIGIEERW